VNEKGVSVADKSTLYEVREQHMANADVVIYNGFQTTADKDLKEADEIVLIKKGEIPDKSVIETLMMARHTPGVFKKLKSSVVGIAGVGGLGSNVAVALARSGVGTLVIADFDIVEPSNLNRQAYFIEHLGYSKVEALKKLLLQINPFVKVVSHQVRITADNALDVFESVDVLVEAFDQAESKAELVNTALTSMPDKHIVAGSGMAGYFSSNDIVTKQKFKKLYVVGDETNEAKVGSGLMAPRVNVAAGHQSNMVLRILLGQLTP